jgi:tetratricopeptide (TPR) repeat protein
MDSSAKHMEWIDKYLDDQLTPAEMEEFEKMQRKDGSFKKLVDDMKILAGGIRQSAGDSLRLEMQGWESKLQDTENREKARRSMRMRRFGWISLAAAACLTAMIYIGISRPDGSERFTNSIFRDHYDGAFQNVVSLAYRSESTAMRTHGEAFDAYDRKDYREAAALFSAIPQKSDTVLFYLGQSWLAIKEYDKATSCFRASLESGQFMADQSRWYLALSLLKSGRAEEAETILRELSANPNFYQEQASDILSRLSTLHKPN